MQIKFKDFFLYLTESINADASEYFVESTYIQLDNILQEFIDGKKHVSWPRIPAPRLIKVWNDFGKTGIVRDEKGVLLIKHIVLNNIVRLSMTTRLWGHEMDNPQDIIDETDFEIDLSDSDTGERFLTFLTDKARGYQFLSDYAIRPLQQLYLQIFNTDSPEKLIYLIDKVLNIIHQRSDLADMFVQGGSATLLKTGDYMPEDE